jgi:hypothetical protein
MAARIPVEVLEFFAIVGTHDVVPEMAAERYGGLADAVSLFLPTDIDPGPLGDVARDFKGIESSFPVHEADWNFWT